MSVPNIAVKKGDAPVVLVGCWVSEASKGVDDGGVVDGPVSARGRAGDEVGQGLDAEPVPLPSMMMYVES